MFEFSKKRQLKLNASSSNLKKLLKLSAFRWKKKLLKLSVFRRNKRKLLRQNVSKS